jgi:hypothetical protein
MLCTDATELTNFEGPGEGLVPEYLLIRDSLPGQGRQYISVMWYNFRTLLCCSIFLKCLTKENVTIRNQHIVEFVNILT